MRKKIIQKSYLKLIVASAITGLVSTFLADSLKKITAYFEDKLFSTATHFHLLFIILPTLGITMIYFLRKYLFKNKQNKGITEIYSSMGKRKEEMPFFKIPSHYINGFLTVVFGGSTGIEVSTVVATAAFGATMHRKMKVAKSFKAALLCAGAAAGIGTLFVSPIAGFLFGMEVIARKFSKTVCLSCLSSVMVSWLYLSLVKNEKLFTIPVTDWHLHAIPYFILLSILCALMAVYFTKCVIFIKAKFGAIQNNFLRVNIGAIVVGLSILAFPQLYGDSYHAIPKLLDHVFSIPFILMLLSLVVLKPLITSLSLGAGGDGGVFAPSIITGAILGILVAVFCNHYLHTQLYVLNFALIGAAAVLSAAIHAPFTALFLTCGLVPGGFIIFIPVMMGSFLAKYIAKAICNYTVYSYKDKMKEQKILAV